MLALALLSCKREALPIANLEQENNPVGFSAYSQKTKASVADISTLKNDGFGVFGFSSDYSPYVKATFFGDSNDMSACQEVTFGANGWTYSPMRYWPSDNSVLSFIAFSPYSTGMKYLPADDPTKSGSLVNTGAKMGDFTVKNVIGTQIDLLVATKFNTPEVPKVILEFKHVLSRIGFSAYAPGIEDDKDVIVTSIELKNATSNEGVFRANGALYVYKDETAQTYEMTWGVPIYTTDIIKQNFKLQTEDFENGGTVTATPARLNKEDKYIMLLPQGELGNLKIQVNYTVGGEEKTKAFTCPVLSFDMGKAYTFNFNLGSSEVLFDCSVEDWDNSSYSLNAGSEVVAASSNPEFDVFIDAQKSTDEAGNAVTNYSLFAEIDTTSSGVAMLPVWKAYFNKGDGNGPVLTTLPQSLTVGSITMTTTTSEVMLGDSRYSKLSFTMNDENKGITSGTYFADYIEEPIKAATFIKSSTLPAASPSPDEESTYSSTNSPAWSNTFATAAAIEDFNAINIERSYTADVSKHDYTKNAVVTLKITKAPLNNAVFRGWFAMDGEESVDISGSEFTINEDNSLTFNEYYKDEDNNEIVARHYTFYARFVLEKTSLVVNIGFEDVYGFYHTSSGIKLVTEPIELKALKPADGIEFHWKMQNTAGEWTVFEFVDGENTVTYDGVEFTRGEYSDEEGEYNTLSFTPKHTINNYVFGVKYGDPINIICVPDTNLTEGSDYEITVYPQLGQFNISTAEGIAWYLYFADRGDTTIENIENEIYTGQISNSSLITQYWLSQTLSNQKKDWKTYTTIEIRIKQLPRHQGPTEGDN